MSSVVLADACRSRACTTLTSSPTRSAATRGSAAGRGTGSSRAARRPRPGPRASRRSSDHGDELAARVVRQDRLAAEPRDCADSSAPARAGSGSASATSRTSAAPPATAPRRDDAAHEVDVGDPQPARLRRPQARERAEQDRRRAGARAPRRRAPRPAPWSRRTAAASPAPGDVRREHGIAGHDAVVDGVGRRSERAGRAARRRRSRPGPRP